MGGTTQTFFQLSYAIVLLYLILIIPGTRFLVEKNESDFVGDFGNRSRFCLRNKGFVPPDTRVRGPRPFGYGMQNKTSVHIQASIQAHPPLVEIKVRRGTVYTVIVVH